MEKEARAQAERIFMEAKGKISNIEISKQVGAHPLTVGKWKRQDDWSGKLAEARAKRPEMAKQTSVRKKEAHDAAFKAYVGAGGKISNQGLADQVKVSAASIASWKASESWVEKLKVEPEPQAREIESAEETVDVSPVQEIEQVEEIEIDVDAMAYPDHITLLNKQIDEILGRGHLSPIDIKTVAEAKEAVLKVVIAYLEVVEMTAEG